ncbi:MerR family transcriptional regulator [Oscillospiraceae bacterium LTW-04]|nr:MerR family transcriptional regulator [Oscillospiraceae bacterium MB24-C1]
MRTYKTAEVANIIGVHPNTVRLYEELRLIPKPERLHNGYRIFTDLHIQQFQLARTALEIEVLQNGLRKKIMDVVKTSAACNFDKALALTKDYLEQIHMEQQNASEAIEIATQLLKGNEIQARLKLKRKEVSEYLGLSMDCLRNWEMNGLLQVKRKENGYRVYTNADIQRLKIIRSLRCGGYSLAAILRMLTELSVNPNTNVKLTLNTPRPDEDIITVCDRLITSLTAAEANALVITQILIDMKEKYL